MTLAAARVLVVGVGGLGSPAARVLVRSGIGSLTLLDDDLVEAANLHRQVLFGEADVDRPKVEVAARALEAEAARAGSRTAIATRAGRLLPENARALVRDHDLVLEGADNLATKFLVADACALEGVPSVQAGAVRLRGWALATLPRRSACLRCVFEDLPRDRAETCAEAGILGPVVGVLGALEAGLALELLEGHAQAAGTLWSYDAAAGTLRRGRVRPRRGCPLCEGAIDDCDRRRYEPGCAPPVREAPAPTTGDRP